MSAFRLLPVALLSAGALIAVAAKNRAQTPTAQPATVTITADTAAKGVPVPASLYGVFFEEINHAGDGGLYGELVRNRSFEDDTQLAGWKLVNYASVNGGTVAIGSVTANPLNAQNPTALQVQITEVPKGGWVGTANEGYWGIPVRKGKKYLFSQYARRDERFGDGKLIVRLESADGKKVYAEAKLPALTGEWQRQTATLTAKEDDPKARLAVLGDRPGKIWLDTVSLFPKDTFKGRENGLRADLAEMVASLKPGFFRFPGGCFVEGDRMAGGYRWKNTIGDIAERPGRACLWGYRSTEGLGYHEYLQLCEDVGAVPLLVVNCGMAHRDVIPMDQLEPWVQDALDALEYANGPVTSKWGAMRARAEHPKPFNVGFVEIGNENGGPAYNERYARFYDAIRKAYPEVKLIANLWGGLPTSRGYDLIDEHYYYDPNWFFQNANRYDNYSRTGPKIFVGEYAVTSGAGTGNLVAGLSEAAFMMGMERNADVVNLAAYAPLFVNVNDRKWNPDAICFDGTRVYGTPSYHVQRMFAEARPDVSLPTTVRLSAAGEKSLVTHGAMNGAVGVGTWRTQAEYKDILVTGPDNQPLTSRVTPHTVGGTWQTEGGVYKQTDEGEDRRLVLGDPNWTDYTVTLKARKTGGAEGFLILFRTRDDRNFYWWNIGGWNNTRHAVERAINGGKSIVGREVNGSIETNRWYDIKVEVKGYHVRCYLDGKLIHDFEEQGTPLFHALVGKRGGEYIVKAVNGSEELQPVEIVLSGAGEGKAATTPANAMILTGPALNSENSLEHPEGIAPRTAKVQLPTENGSGGRKVRYTIPPRSLVVLRLPANP